MTDVGATVIMESLQFNSSLKKLYLPNDKINKELMKKIEEELKSSNRYEFEVL